jgi:fumarate reductase subunit D
MAEQVQLDQNEIKDGAPFAALSYVFFLWILVFIFRKSNQFAHFHAKQGIVVFIGEIVFIVLSLLPIIGIVFYVSGLLLFLFLSLYGIYSSLTGKMARMRFISNVADKFVV